MAMFFLRPCANCGILIQGGRNLFCGELCKQAAKAVRYARAVIADGRIELPDVQEAVIVKIAFVAGGGYDEAARRITPERRQEVTANSDGKCVRCGAPGDEIDHINGSSDSPDNLQLLCRSCHKAKTDLSLRPASDESVRLVHHPLWERIRADEPHQPSDASGWAWRQWASTVPDKELAQTWLSWCEVRLEGDEQVTPAEAAAGFPEWLEPWLWHGEGIAIS